MQVTIQSFGMIRSLLGEKLLPVEVPEGATVFDAVAKAVEKGGTRAKRLIFSPDGKGLKVVTMLDGKTVPPDTPVYDGAEISLMLTIGGGR